MEKPKLFENILGFLSGPGVFFAFRPVQPRVVCFCISKGEMVGSILPLFGVAENHISYPPRAYTRQRPRRHRGRGIGTNDPRDAVGWSIGRVGCKKYKVFLLYAGESMRMDIS